jgi:hypothetical protein
MLHVYLNYPNFSANMHHRDDCRSVRPADKPDQRIARINRETLSAELMKFADKDYKFAAFPERNDMWLDIDLEDVEFEEAVAAYILRLVSRHYTPFRGIPLRAHC